MRVGTILAWLTAFFIYWTPPMFIFGAVVEKGGDLKPVAWLCLILAVIDACFLTTATWAFADFTTIRWHIYTLLGIEIVSLVLIFLGLRFIPRLLRPGALVLVLTGVWCTYLGLRFIFAMMGVGPF